MRKLFSIAVLCAGAIAAGCGGGSDDTLSNPNPGGAPGGPGAVRMGSGTGGAFQDGVLGIGVTNLAAGGSTGLTVTFVDSTGALFTDSVTVTFSSACAGSGLATIDSPVQTTTGVANATYAATGCNGDDLITASANVNGVNLTATGTVTVAPAAVGSIEFVSATPTNIGLRGTGGVGRSETSTVVFNVVDATGGPVADADVQFTLNQTPGGITLTPTTATSAADGRVQTVVQAGTVATVVRVTATVVSVQPPIATQSDQLTITTGIPDQNSASLSVETPNVEAWAIDGVAVDVTIRLSDRFNNPVPDGTAVTLNVEGGQIGGQCTTVTTPADGAGVCTVTWVSQAPRPPDGRVTIMATAIGEESFVDSDGNGVFGNADVSFDDIGEIFRDDNENGMYDAGETFLDFNNNAARDPADGLFNGLLCADTTGRCSAEETLGIGSNNVIVMSSGSATIVPSVNPLDLTGGSATITFSIGDAKGNGTTPQPMAEGTTVTASTTNGNIVGPNSFSFAKTSFNGPINFSFTLEPDTTPSSGTLLIEVESPSGILTIASVTVND